MIINLSKTLYYKVYFVKSSNDPVCKNNNKYIYIFNFKDPVTLAKYNHLKAKVEITK